MTRAAVLIGVNKTGGLPQLSDAANGARDMAAWALGQGMAAKNIHLFTDETGAVEAHTIRAAIASLVDAGNITQLFFYFAGHGVNIRYGEYWLLSRAPGDASAAINVDGCVYRARTCGIPHVVFISDACRTAAQGIQGQGIDGSVVFPNDPVPGPEQAVDMFFATTLGRPALEIREAANAVTAYKALYTRAFLDAVSGRLPGCMVVDGTARVVRPRLLKTCLSAALPQRMAQMAIAATASQIPDARVTSGDEAWLARFAMEPLPVPPPSSSPGWMPRGGVLGSLPRGAGAGPTPRVPMPAATPRERAARAIGDLLLDDMRRPAGRQSRGASNWKSVQLPYRRDTTKSGIAITGGVIDRCFIPGNPVAITRHADWIELAPDGPAVDALLTFADGSATLLPVIAGYITSLTIDDGELADVAFVPALASPVTGAGAGAGPDDVAIRLRAAVAAAARQGIFQLDRTDGDLLAAHMQQAGAIDPGLALYAAYGFHDQQMRAPLLALDDALKKQCGVSLFDIGMLAKRLPSGTSRETGYLPALPLLARGWAIWASAQPHIQEPLSSLRRELLPSLWTHFTAAGAASLRTFLSTGE